MSAKLTDPKANDRWRRFWRRVQRLHAQSHPVVASPAGTLAQAPVKAGNKKAPP